MIQRISINTNGQGLYSFTDKLLSTLEVKGITSGLCTIYIQHTSASLLIQENYDPSAQFDLENWIKRLIPENDPLYTHTLEGSDDMPAHIKAAITATSLSIPIENEKLLLGTWQGIFLWEHRNAPQQRDIIIHTLKS